MAGGGYGIGPLPSGRYAGLARANILTVFC